MRTFKIIGTAMGQSQEMFEVVAFDDNTAIISNEDLIQIQFNYSAFLENLSFEGMITILEVAYPIPHYHINFEDDDGIGAKADAFSFSTGRTVVRWPMVTGQDFISHDIYPTLVDFEKTYAAFDAIERVSD